MDLILFQACLIPADLNQKDNFQKNKLESNENKISRLKNYIMKHTKKTQDFNYLRNKEYDPAGRKNKI